MMHGRPQYGQNLYGGQYNDNGSPNPGWEDVIHWNNGIRDYVFYHGGLQPKNQEIPQDSWGGSPLLRRGRARGGGGAHNPLPVYHPRINVMGSYLGSMTIPSVVGGQAKLRQKRHAEYDDEEYERQRQRRRRRKRPRGPPGGQKNPGSPLGQGLVLGKAHRCPKKAGGQPLRFSLNVDPSRR